MDQKQKIKILQDLVQIQSVNDNERKVALYIKNLLSSYNIDGEMIIFSENRSNLIFEVVGENKGKNKTLAFSGHFDVVGVGDESEWLFPPFMGEINNGYMYGRGTADMKAGVAAMVIAMIELHEEGLSFSGTLRFLGSVGEEIGMLGSHQLTNAGYSKDLDALVIAEPTNGDIVFAHKGSLQYEIVSFGQSAHSSMPHKGINALTQLTEFIQQAEEIFNEKTKKIINNKLGPITNSFTVIKGGEQLNSIPSKITVSANTRTIPEFDNKQVIQLLTDSIYEFNQNHEGKLKLKVLHSILPVESSPDSQIIQSILDTTNKELKITTLAGATDASNYLQLNNKIELAVFSIFDYDQAHTIDEKVNIKDYLDSINIYKEIAKNYLK